MNLAPWILGLNTSSSSVKYGVHVAVSRDRLCRGAVDRISGLAGAPQKTFVVPRAPGPSDALRQRIQAGPGRDYLLAVHPEQVRLA